MAVYRVKYFFRVQQLIPMVQRLIHRVQQLIWSKLPTKLKLKLKLRLSINF